MAWAASMALAACLGGGVTGAWAQSDISAAPANAAASASPPASTSGSEPGGSAPAVPEALAVPKYSAGQIKMIFNYLDRNHDGVISREEAAGFKGVARNFDRADTNHDSVLSFEEFEFAMNRAK